VRETRTLTSLGDARDATTDARGDAMRDAGRDVALTRVHTHHQCEAELFRRRTERASAADGASGTIEHDHHAVVHTFHGIAAEAG
jgi:hypothetical protein